MKSLLVGLLLAQVALPHEGLYPPPMTRLREKMSSGEERRCIYLYTMWDNISNWERSKFCTVPFKRDPDIGFLLEWPVHDPKPDPPRMLQSPFPELECQGNGCKP